MSQREQVAITSRVFCLAAILGLSLVARDATSIQTVIAVCVIGAMSAYVSYATGRTTLLSLTAETLLVGIVMALTFPSSVILMPYLVVLPLLAGLFRGFPGVLITMLAQVAAIVVVPLASSGFVDAGDRVISLAPWLLTNFGGGLLGVWARSLGISQGRAVDKDSHYESARQLLTQLRNVTRRLSAGLDSDGMAAQLMALLHEHLDDSYSAVFVNMKGSVLVPLGYRGIGAQQILVPNDAMVEQCWAEMEPVQGVVPSGNRDARHRLVLPLRVGNRMIGVAVSSSADSPDQATRDGADGRGRRAQPATRHRPRLRRDPHHGDGRRTAAAGPRDPRRDRPGGGLPGVRRRPHGRPRPATPTWRRACVTSAASCPGWSADLRLSIFDLRSDVSATNGLGAALSDYVRQVGAKSDLTVHLTLNEAPTRLAPSVEAELLRIAQEAITNARKHAVSPEPVGRLLDRPASRQPRRARRRTGHERWPGRLLRHLDHARARPADRRESRHHQRVRHGQSAAERS